MPTLSQFSCSGQESSASYILQELDPSFPPGSSWCIPRQGSPTPHCNYTSEGVYIAGETGELSADCGGGRTDGVQEEDIDGIGVEDAEDVVDEYDEGIGIEGEAPAIKEFSLHNRGLINTSQQGFNKHFTTGV